MKLDWFLYRAFNKFLPGKLTEGRVSYSQCGEDMIIRYIFDVLRIPAPVYIDIGAHHPTHLNNTFIFYQNGSHGVNVEPDLNLIDAFNRMRPRDINVNKGIAEKSGYLDFYIMSASTLNTFSFDDAYAATREGKVEIDRVVKVPVVPINDILVENFSDKELDFVSVDVEGLDLKILQSFDFIHWRPKVLCAETITYSEQHKGKKISEIEQVMLDQGYFVYADTYINTIFVDRNVW